MKATETIPFLSPNLPLKSTEASCFNITKALGEKKENLPQRKGGYIMYLYHKDYEGRQNFTGNLSPTNCPALVILNPNHYTATEGFSEINLMYCCSFNEDFIKGSEAAYHTRYYSLTTLKNKEIFYLTVVQAAFIKNMFENIMAEMHTEYAYKYDIIRNYIQLILLEVFKSQSESAEQKNTRKASARISSQFIQLLEKQFPVESPLNSLKLKTARDYAEQLSVHVNHLNSAVRTTTGKTTTAHITERMIREAKVLLKNTNWNVSEIAYSLGFDYPTYFNNFFKKHTDFNPLYFRS